MSWTFSGGAELLPTRAGEIGWNAGTNLTYQRGKTGLGLSYNHGYTGGTGVFTGSKTHTAFLSLTRMLSRAWGTGISVGFANNVQLGAAANEFNSGYAGAQLNRSVGHVGSIYASYGFQRQSATVTTVIPGVPGNLSRHIVAIGFNWQSRPVSLGR